MVPPDPLLRIGTLRVSSGRRRNPVMRLLMAIVAVMVFIGVVVLGTVIFLAFLGFLAASIAFIAARVWWLRRKYRRSGTIDRPAGVGRVKGEIFDGEWRSVDRSRGGDDAGRR